MRLYANIHVPRGCPFVMDNLVRQYRNAKRTLADVEKAFDAFMRLDGKTDAERIAYAARANVHYFGLKQKLADLRLAAGSNRPTELCGK